MDIFNNSITKKGLWLLFSACAIPIHVWAIVLFFRDFSWISDRTNAWDAIGVGAYGLIIAFFESSIVFLIAFLISMIFVKVWSPQKRVVLIGTLVIFVSFWAVLGQLFFLLKIQLPQNLIFRISQQTHPLRILYGSLFSLVLLTLLFPVFFIIRSEGFEHRIYNFFDRLSVLTMLYLFLDIGGLIIVIVRNI